MSMSPGDGTRGDSRSAEWGHVSFSTRAQMDFLAPAS